jgi:pimeloyl-ACP methyl ester carboxylesterase
MSEQPADVAHAEPLPTGGPTTAVKRSGARGRLRKFFIRAWLPIVTAFVIYLFVSYRARGFDAAILRSDQRVTVTDASGLLTLAPVDHTHAATSSSLIFIPGAMVDPTAYAPLAREVALRGHAVTIVKLPARMASFEWQRNAVVSRVADVVRANPERKWIVGGHSVGGVVACYAARDHVDLLAGLVLIGTSHPRDFDLSRLTLDVTKITATRDGLASPAEVRANANRLPTATHWISIDGGNHSQFGYYGFQLGDHAAAISRADQQSQTVAAIVDALRRADAGER